MVTRSRVQQRAEMGERLALPVAAQLARTQLVLQPARNGEHPAETLNLVAQALARTAPLQVTDARTGETRTLSAAELEGAAARNGAVLLVLNDGRTLSGVSIRRADLRQAIAILKAVGLPHAAVAPAAAPEPGHNGHDVLRARFAEIDALLREPLLPAQVERAKAGAVWIARHAAEGRVANLAMQLMSALHETHGIDEVPGGFRMALARLRAALEEPAA